MDDRTSRTSPRAQGTERELAPPIDGAVTGVATGSLGTGTALDDTQEYDVAEWLGERSAAPPAGAAPADEHVAPPQPLNASQAAPARMAAPASQPAASDPTPMIAAASAAPTHAPIARHVPVTAPARRARSSRGSSVGPREAGILAAILLVLVGAFALTNGNILPGAGVPPAGAGATPTAPAATEATDDDDDDDDDGDSGGGGGGGNGGNGNGGGNGRGNNGNGNGNGGGGGND